MSNFETENITKILGNTTHPEPRKKKFSSLFQSQLNSLIFKLTEMGIASNSIKPGSHMPPTYLATKQPVLPVLTYGNITPPATRPIAVVCRWHACEVELKSTSQA